MAVRIKRMKQSVRQREGNQEKAPEVEECLALSRNSKEASWLWRESEGGGEQKTKSET